ncbi:hypothetical protein SAMN04488056_108191 [Cohaesibacter marisflavi]|uniref:Uncharacterized protein n=1 Tax=Cohaesibacter marisflavi TaxID=655353 RepID=A0A1I5ICZ2_9HYPH|nr:hypothetical protein [Cohaesibacter marisflavi]SFO58382.1 hypothetical protein SAMN04488056_108191 [Cohaesibacter marisflavi]
MTWILSLFSNWRVILACAGFAFLLASHTFAYWKGHWIASQACQTAALEAENANLKRDIEINKKALETAVQRAQVRDAQAITLEQKVEDYEAQLEDAGTCVLSAADAQRLQEIR